MQATRAAILAATPAASLEGVAATTRASRPRGTRVLGLLAQATGPRMEAPSDELRSTASARC